MPLLLAAVAAFVGANLGGPFGLVFGGLLGYGSIYVWRQGKDLEKLKQQVVSLVSQMAITAPPAQEQQSVEAPVQPTPEPEPVSEPSDPRAAPAATSAAPQPSQAVTPDSTEQQRPRTPRPVSQVDKFIATLVERITKFFTTGNLVVRVGVIVLFFGIAFLLNYAYEHSMIPVELRLAGAGLGGIALTAFGWRLRGRSDTYGLVLQGAGVGVLYLTIFASTRLYELVPASVTFILLIALVVASSVLAVLQKSQALAIFAMSGGFLTPVLLSAGTGSHVVLFSYYALLNAGILAMAWFQFWRWLNWVGFIFTFAIGASWGIEYYQPEHFATTEPFLILFFLYYLGVSVLFARKQDVNLRGVVDGTLVFGTPIIAFALQASMVQNVEFGLAYSALGAAATYVILAWWLKRQETFSELLGQSFVALAVVFASLAIPFAFDNQRFTAATWAVEGAGLFWLGLAQRDRLARAFGILLQIAAAGAFILEAGSSVAPTLFLNSAFLGAALLSIAGGYTAYLMSTRAESLHRFESLLRWLFLPMSVIWWFAGGTRELQQYVGPNNTNENLFVLFVALTIATTTLLAKRYNWKDGLLPGFLILPVMALTLLDFSAYGEGVTAFSDFGWLAWPAAIGAFGWHLRQTDEHPRLGKAWHAGGWWFLTFFVTWNVNSLVSDLLPDSAWSAVLWGAIPLSAAALLLRSKQADYWPFTAAPASYFGWGWVVMLGYLTAWLLVTGTYAADPDPLPYLVLANPIELVQIAILLIAAVWIRGFTDADLSRFNPAAKIGLGVLGFIWLNTTAARAIHFYAGIDYPIERIFETDTFQTTASILWTLVAVSLMGFGRRKSERPIWIAGAALLGVVILKLFTLDLANLDIVARIVSFITVGVLMLIIGYFSPIPPDRREEEEAQST